MYYIGIDIGGTNIKYGLVTDQGEISNFNEIETEAKLGAKHIINKIYGIINFFIEDNKGFIKGIAISTAGQVDSEKGEIIFATDAIRDWTGVKLRELIESKFNYTCTVENDVNCAALGELWKGVAKDENSFLCLTIGTGIGGAIVINNKIFTGSAYSAGEFGHINLYPKGRKCACGSYGCYEAYASTSALVKSARETLLLDDNYKINGRDIFYNANKGIEIYSKIVDSWCYDIALGLKTLVNIFNPNLIVIGGGVSLQGENLISRIKENLDQMLMLSLKKNLIIKTAKCGNTSGMLGAVYFHKTKVDNIIYGK